MALGWCEEWPCTTSKPAASIRAWAKRTSLSAIPQPQLPPQWIEATRISPGRRARRARVAIALSVRSDRSRSRLTPGRPAPAAHSRGTPLLVVANAKTRTRPPWPSGIAAGAGAANARRGQAVQRLDQPPCAEIEHVIVRQRAAIDAGRGQAGDVARVHLVVDAFGRVIPTRGDAGFEIDDPRIRRQAPPLGERIAPDIGVIRRLRDRAVHALGERDVGPRRAHIGFAQGGIAGMREDLIDAAPEHHV